MSRFTRTLILCCITLPLLASCETPSWLGGSAKEIKRAPGERTDVIFSATEIKPDDSVKDIPVEIPDQVNLDNWLSRNDAMLTPHVGLTGVEHHDSARIGLGDPFSRENAPAPIVVEGMVIAMDGSGNVSAHDTNDISHRLWSLDTNDENSYDDVGGGGFAYADGVVYISLGFGRLVAVDAKTGKQLWSVAVGAPVRGAPAISAADKRVIVLTADNQTLAYDTEKGEPRWQHRGIREAAGYYSNTAPVISEGIVVVCYSSGEVFALRAETGNILWNDTVVSPLKNVASAVFNGIDADPIVQDGVVVLTSSSGDMQASALLNGRPLWQQKIGAHTTPWSAGNAVFALATTHDLVAILKRNGAVRWATSLAKNDGRGHDTTPSMYGPIIAGNAVLVISGDGKMLIYSVRDGRDLGEKDLTRNIISAPVIANGALYLISRNGKLHKFY